MYQGSGKLYCRHVAILSKLWKCITSIASQLQTLILNTKRKSRPCSGVKLEEPGTTQVTTNMLSNVIVVVNKCLREAKIADRSSLGQSLLTTKFRTLARRKFRGSSSNSAHALNIFENALGEQNRTATHAFHSTATRRTLAGDPVDLGRTHRLLAAIAATVGQSTIALDHLNTALAIFEQYDRQQEIALICGDMGDVYLRKGEHILAQATLRRSLSIAERIGDASIMSVAFANLGILAARFGDLSEAEACFKQGTRPGRAGE